MRKPAIDRPWRALFLLMLCAIATPLAAEEDYIANIRFAGNEKTRPGILLQEMPIKVGDRVNSQLVEASRQNIMNLGLFKSVTADVLGEGPDKELLISVEERYFILPIPLLDVRPEGSYSYGVDLRHDNLFGQNQRLKISYEDKRSIAADGEPAKKIAINYVYPRIVGTPYSLGMNLKRAREDVNGEEDGYADTFYKLDNQSFGLNVSRWLNRRGATTGWYSGLGMEINQRDYTPVSGMNDVYVSGSLLTAQAFVGYKDVTDQVYFRSGHQYAYNLLLGLPQLGSDFSYNSSLLSYRNYLPFAANKANLNSQFRLGLANGSTFGNPIYGLGGYSTLRGYETNYARGNAFFVANVEVLRQISGFSQLRALAFADIGNAWPGVMEMAPEDMHAGMGAGLRWRVLSFVDLHLSLELAYGIETDSWMTYFSTSGNF